MQVKGGGKREDVQEQLVGEVEIIRFAMRGCAEVGRTADMVGEGKVRTTNIGKIPYRLRSCDIE